jgi:RimJ/RimL family protein N-acetyltransferase
VSIFSRKRNQDEVVTAEPIERPAAGEFVRSGRLVDLRVHVPEGRAAFQRWYADPEIARLLRHDQEPLSASDSRAYFDTITLPSSALGFCYAIHDRETERLIGTTALTDLVEGPPRRCFFRILIGERAYWGGGRGTEATRLVMEEAFTRHGLDEVRLEVFEHNPRAVRAYLRVGFEQYGRHVEWVRHVQRELHVLEMRLTRERWEVCRETISGPVR